jgi:hypothetical protein
MKKLVKIFMVPAFGLMMMGNALAGVPSNWDLYTCDGATFADGYTATVELDDGWEGYAFQAEDDFDGTCKDKKADGFACTKSGNLITSGINDDATFKLFAASSDEEDLDLPANDGDPTYAVVHADIFQPGDCAVAFDCNHDEDDGTTAEISCFDSGFPNGPWVDGFFDNAEDSCSDAAGETGEGMFADGDNFSPNRPKPGNKAHKNWAMYVELTASCQSGLIAVTANNAAPSCNSAEHEVDGIADGGDVATAFAAGTVTFTPDTDCSATLECEDSTSQIECIVAP